MIEYLKLNIDERYAPTFFADDEGRRLDTSRDVRLALGDPRIPAIAALEQRLWNDALEVPCTWRAIREFDTTELDAAPLLHVEPREELRTTAEQAGTRYDELTACPACGSGATLVPPVRINLGAVPSSAEFVRTFGGEWLIAESLRDELVTLGVTGADFEPASSARKGRAGAGRRWYILRVRSQRLRIVPPTRYGNHVVLVTEEPNECARGDKLGLIQLTPLHVQVPAAGTSDFNEAEQFFGMSGGLVRAKRPLFISQRVRALLVGRGNNDLVVEVPRIVL